MALADENRERFRRIAASARGIPGELGLRPYTVAILRDNWSGEHVGSGVEFESPPVPVTERGGQPPKVDFDSEDPLAKTRCTIGPITPPYGEGLTAGGTALDELVRRVAVGQASYVLVTGPAYPEGARFAVLEAHTDKALHWLLDCEHSDFQPE